MTSQQLELALSSTRACPVQHEEDDKPLQWQLQQATRDWWTCACRHWPQLQHAHCPAVRFDLRGRSAGQLRLRQNLYRLLPETIRYNLPLARQYRDDFISRTVPHEVAHAVAVIIFGRHGTGHGAGWREVMQVFGKPAERCHHYDVSRHQARRHRTYAYTCNCDTAHQLGSTRHRRMQTGERVYLCQRCKGVLQIATADG